MRRQFFHSIEVFGARRTVFSLHNGRFQGGGREDFQVLTAPVRARELRRYYLTLLGNPDARLHRAVWLRQNRLVGWSPSATDRTPSSMEQTKRDIVDPTNFNQS